MRCPHCGIPDRNMWPTDCRWQQMPQAGPVECGADPPCSMDEYNERQYARERQLERRVLLFGFLIPATVLTLIVWWKF